MPLNTKQMPPLKEHLRPSLAQYAQLGYAVWNTAAELDAPNLTPEARQLLSRLCRADQREADEAWARLCRERADLLKEAGIEPTFLENNLAQEIALNQLERAATDLAQGTVDGVLAIRLGLYALNGQVEAAVQRLAQQDGRPWWEARQLYAQWDDVMRLEQKPAQRQRETKKRTAALQGQISGELTGIDAKERERREIDQLLAYASRSLSAPVAAEATAPASKRRRSK